MDTLSLQKLKFKRLMFKHRCLLVQFISTKNIYTPKDILDADVKSFIQYVRSDRLSKDELSMIALFHNNSMDATQFALTRAKIYINTLQQVNNIVRDGTREKIQQLLDERGNIMFPATIDLFTQVTLVDVDLFTNAVCAFQSGEESASNRCSSPTRHNPPSTPLVVATGGSENFFLQTLQNSMDTSAKLKQMYKLHVKRTKYWQNSAVQQNSVFTQIALPCIQAMLSKRQTLLQTHIVWFIMTPNERGKYLRQLIYACDFENLFDRRVVRQQPHGDSVKVNAYKKDIKQLQQLEDIKMSILGLDGDDNAGYQLYQLFRARQPFVCNMIHIGYFDLLHSEKPGANIEEFTQEMREALPYIEGTKSGNKQRREQLAKFNSTQAQQRFVLLAYHNAVNPESSVFLGKHKYPMDVLYLLSTETVSEINTGVSEAREILKLRTKRQIR